MLEKITGTFSGIIRTLSGKSSITEKNIEETVEQIKMALLEADVNLRVVRRFVNSTIEEAKGEKVLKAVDPGQQFVKIIYDKLAAMLGDKKTDLALKGPDTQSVIRRRACFWGGVRAREKPLRRINLPLVLKKMEGGLCLLPAT